MVVLWRAVWFSVLLCACRQTSCASDDRQANAAQGALDSPVDQADLYALDAKGRQQRFERLRERARAAVDDDARVAAALEAARVARAAVRLGDGDRLVGAARTLLSEAAALSERPAVCDATLALAHFEALVAGDLATAYVWAHRARERFTDVGGCERCVAEATVVLDTLADYRPSAERLAAGPAAPTPAGSEGVTDTAIADFVKRRATPSEKGVALEEISVYGADVAGERPLSASEVRVVLRFDGPAVYRRGELPATGELPRRLVLDIDDVVLSSRISPAIAVGAGGLDRIRSFALEQGRTRISFDVQPQTGYRLFFLDNPYRVIMDFRDESSARTAQGRVVVVLDAGHGGEQPGAKGPNGIKESAVALALARRVRAVLARRRPDVFVAMTRDEDRFLTLEERTAIANGVDADLFVSIHLNASHSPDDKGGVSTFVLDTTDDEAALRLAARENGTDAAGVTELQFILASLYREDQVSHSLELAQAVHAATLVGGRRVLPDLNDRGVRRALFYVLVGARMPAVLIEASFITRPEEAAALATDAYRDALSEGIAEGIVRYLERRRAAR